MTPVPRLILLLFLTAIPCLQAGDIPKNGWGIDARVGKVKDPATRAILLRRLKNSNITWLRQGEVSLNQLDGPGLRRLEEITRAGFSTIGVADISREVRPQHPENVLGEDLLAVAEAGKRLAAKAGSRVTVWELMNEPDTGVCPDLPDRFSSYAKALYYGLKDGGRRHVPVISSAFALPPGPWLERAAANGILDAADGCNFHFYGEADQFPGAINTYRKFLQDHGHKDLPLWVTEAGLNAETSEQSEAASRRRLQTKFFKATCKEAEKASISTFFPFCLQSPNKTLFEGFALLDRQQTPYPAWEAYAQQTLKRSLTFQISGGPNRPNPVVLQWVPGFALALPHKMSGTYRFRTINPATGNFFMSGLLYVYNLGDEPVEGTVYCTPPRKFPCSMSGEGTHVPLAMVPRSRLVFAVDFEQPANGHYQRDVFRAVFKSNRLQDCPPSTLEFGIETPPEAVQPTSIRPKLEKVPLRPPPARGLRSFGPELIQPGPVPVQSWESTTLAWTCLNGLRLRPDSLSPHDSSTFWIESTGENRDPLARAMAVARLPEGMAGRGFLEVECSRNPSRSLNMRIDLLDAEGHRYSVWENGGANYFMQSPILFLHDLDFQTYFWGKIEANSFFDPSKAREIRLYPHMEKGQAPWRIRLRRLITNLVPQP